MSLSLTLVGVSMVVNDVPQLYMDFSAVILPPHFNTCYMLRVVATRSETLMF